MSQRAEVRAATVRSGGAPGSKLVVPGSLRHALGSAQAIASMCFRRQSHAHHFVFHAHRREVHAYHSTVMDPKVADPKLTDPKLTD